jgi:zinc/manganese transport system substrate-binding protein
MRRAFTRFPTPQGAAFLCLLTAHVATAAPIKILAAESVYGQVAAAIAGDHATVTSVLSNPAQDPHDFEARPSTARAAAEAGIVVLNGAGYDPWMDHLLAAAAPPGRVTINIATLLHTQSGADPHLWYNPAAMAAFAATLRDALQQQDPSNARRYQANTQAFLAAMATLQARIITLRGRYAGVPVTATEPVFNDMAAALGLTMRNKRFQIAIMNGTEPRASDVAAMDADLRTHAVRALILNAQVTSPATQRLTAIAGAAGVAIVPITETMPPGSTYTGWMLTELDALDRALARR